MFTFNLVFNNDFFQDNFEILQQNYVNVKAKERILQSLFDDPHVKISVEEIIQTGNRKFKVYN